MLNFGAGILAKVSLIKVVGVVVDLLLCVVFLGVLDFGLWGIPVAGLLAVCSKYYLLDMNEPVRISTLRPSSYWLFLRVLTGVGWCLFCAVALHAYYPTSWGNFACGVVIYLSISLCIFSIINRDYLISIITKLKPKMGISD